MQKRTGKEKFYGWVMLPILCLAYSIPAGFAMYGPPVINTFMIEELNLQRGQATLAIGGFYLSTDNQQLHHRVWQ